MPEEAGSQEEAHRVVAVPPLGQRVLHTGEGRVALGAEERHRNGQVVDHVQHRNGDDEGQVEPVRHIDVGFLALHDGADEDGEISHPDDGQPKVHIPLRFGVFAALGDAQNVAGCRHDDEQLVAPEHEPGEIAAPQ
jgi:hypothetical protein